MRTHQMFFRAVTSTAFAAVMLAAPSRAVAAIDTNTAGAPAAPTPWQATGVSEVMKMFKGGISADIIESYVKNSPLSYYLSADNIISLQQQGVPAPVLQAMIQRNGELQRQTGMATTAAGGVNVPAQAPPPKYYSYTAADSTASYNAALQARAAAFNPVYAPVTTYPVYEPTYYDPYYDPWYPYWWGGPVVFDVGFGRFGHGGFGGRFGGGHVGGFAGHGGGFGGHGGGHR